LFLSFRDPDKLELFGDVHICVRGTPSSFSGEKVIKIMAMKHDVNVLHVKSNPRECELMLLLLLT